jgi:hypothetical protein
MERLRTFPHNTTLVVTMDPRSNWWTSLLYAEPYSGERLLTGSFFRVEDIVCRALVKKVTGISGTCWN